MSARSERAGARRKVLAQLKSVKDVIKTLESWWNVTGRVYTRPTRVMRDRAPGEYPEAQRLCWASTIKAIDQMANQLEMLRRYCLDEYNATPDGDKS